MPVSHLGLTVSHIPSATSFYLSALQPLGYRYIGQQGDSIGLGVTDADFFLCQERNGSRPSPTHIAFAADSTRAVRDCYAAALNAGGRSSGTPSERNQECKCFNAAVEDLDGNTIEFIFREPCSNQIEAPPPAPGRVQSWQQDVARNRPNDDMRPMSSKAERTKCRAQTAMDVASKASKSMKGSAPPAPTPGISRSRTEPVTSQNGGGKNLVGGLLGAAAGAAILYGMISSERENAREEKEYATSSRSKAPSFKESRPRTNYEGSSLSKRSSHSSKHPSRGMRAIEAPKYDNDSIEDLMSRYTTSRRPLPQRSNTYDASDYQSYAPRSLASHRNDRYSAKRSSTLPIDMPQQYLIEGPRTVPSSRHTSRRGSFDDTKLKRHDSGVSMHSHRSRRSFDGGRRPSMSRTSTIKPPKGSLSKAPSYITAADMPLPRSRTGSYVSAAQYSLPPSRTTAVYSDPEESDGLGDIRTVVPEDSISCVDFSEKSRTSKSKSKSKSGGSKTSCHSSKRSDAPSERTVKPYKSAVSRQSAQTLPMRSKEEHHGKSSKRSNHTYV